MAECEHDNPEADFSAYLDGELSEDRAARVRQVLKESADARRLMEQLRATSRALRTLPRVPAPPELADRLRQAAERRFARAQPRAAGFSHVIRTYGSWTAAAAAVLLAFAAGRLSVEGLTVRARSPSEGAPVARRADADGQKPVGAGSALSGTHDLSAGQAQSPEPASSELPPGTSGRGREPSVADEGASNQGGASPFAQGRDGVPQPAQLADAVAAAPGAVDVIVKTRSAEEFAAKVCTVDAWARDSQSAMDQPAPPPEHPQPGLPANTSRDRPLPQQEGPHTRVIAQHSAGNASLNELILRLQSGNPDGIVFAYRPSDAAVAQQLLGSIAHAYTARRDAGGDEGSSAGRLPDREQLRPVVEAARPRDAREQAYFSEPHTKERHAAAPRATSLAAAPDTNSPPPERDAPAGGRPSEVVPGRVAGRAGNVSTQRTLAGRIAERLRNSLEAWVELADQALGRAAAAEPRPVLIRVTILPPEAEDAPSVEPAPAPDSQPAPQGGLDPRQK